MFQNRVIAIRCYFTEGELNKSRKRLLGDNNNGKKTNPTNFIFIPFNYFHPTQNMCNLDFLLISNNLSDDVENKTP